MLFRFFSIIFVFGTVFLLGCNAEKRLLSNPQKHLNNQVQEMIVMLEEEKFKEFILTYAHPEDLEKMMDDEGSIEELADEFSGGKSMAMLKFLKDALKTDPKFNDDKTTGIYYPASSHMPMKLERIGTNWYIRN